MTNSETGKSVGRTDADAVLRCGTGRYREAMYREVYLPGTVGRHIYHHGTHQGTVGRHIYHPGYTQGGIPGYTHRVHTGRHTGLYTP